LESPAKYELEFSVFDIYCLLVLLILSLSASWGGNKREWVCGYAL